MIPDDWMPHRRADGEVVGYVRLAEGALFQAVDLLGRPMGDPAEWHAIEAMLDEHSIAWLDGTWSYAIEEGLAVRVRIAEVSPARVALVEDRLGSIDGAAPVRYELDVPVEPGVLEPAAPLTEWPPPAP
ncbi:hypothetical protein [Agrococcus sp. SGAir0287]|uniref:hypothetical protein n=1 Tax=Agrococcus sp. SGAir0287 TaxID=2070347 RepID=UPI0010CD3436|nr:hypothetical protein [Agrococcus sp. SGAir0287]QCR18318.1 hypothetical protein C1N71_01680 [Agrococcus sp. SGAir0287]